jgi:hypothetical protein
MKKWSAATVCLFLRTGINAISQVNTASLSGLVKDPSGAVVPDAKVTATENPRYNPATGSAPAPARTR